MSVETSLSEILWTLPLFENLFLSMQGQNVMMVDFYLRDLECDLLSTYIEIERTPVQKALFVSAFSQMWVFSVYELLRTWKATAEDIKGRQRRTESVQRCDKDEPNLNMAEVFRAKKSTEYAADEKFRKELKKALRAIDPLFKRIEALRINLAKHEIKGMTGSVAQTPGYGRINMADGSIFWMVDLGDNAVDMISRRDISDELRSLVLSSSSSISPNPSYS